MKRFFMATIKGLALGIVLNLALLVKAETISHHKEILFWPTPNKAFIQGEPAQVFIQPASSGKLKSGTFGCVRNDGFRFHEGIDLKPIHRNRHREATDSVSAFMAGKVVFVNKIPGNSSYGRYIVIEHLKATLPLYSLYAHLASIDPQIKKGVWVEGETILGQMGRSAKYRIPKERAHLHFEVGFRLSDNFSSWWASQSSKKPQQFGNYHGWNLIGIDPLDLFKKWHAGSVDSLQAYIEQLPTALTLRIYTQKIPSFIKRYPSLLSQPIPYTEIQGWEIDYTIYGVPKRWTPLKKEDIYFLKTPGEVAVIHYDKILSQKNLCRSMIKKDSKTGEFILSKTASSQLEMLFGFR